jgi:hypothetical protein
LPSDLRLLQPDFQFRIEDRFAVPIVLQLRHQRRPLDAIALARRVEIRVPGAQQEPAALEAPPAPRPSLRVAVKHGRLHGHGRLKGDRRLNLCGRLHADACTQVTRVRAESGRRLRR